MQKRVLGVKVDIVSKPEVLEEIVDWTRSRSGRTKIVATAYSEFFVKAESDRDFRMALEGFDLVVPDGIGPLAAIRYQQMAYGKWAIVKVGLGLKTGLDILRGRVGEPVSGYWLFQTLVGMAAENGWRVFLLGGFGETAERLAEKLKMENGKLKIEFDAGAQTEREMDDVVNDRVIQNINEFRPDLLFAAYGPVKQEKWLAANRQRIKARVAMGVGGTFDEALGLVKEAPVFVTRIGLKWFWRLLQQPQRIGRIWEAVVVFPWLVFVDSLREPSPLTKGRK